MTQASQTATSKDIGLASTPRLRRWPLLWTVAFALVASLLLWVGIALAITWVTNSILAPPTL